MEELSFILDKIANKHFAHRMIMEVMGASSKKLTKDCSMSKKQRIFYNYVRQDELKHSRYKDVADYL